MYLYQIEVQPPSLLATKRLLKATDRAYRLARHRAPGSVGVSSIAAQRRCLRSAYAEARQAHARVVNALQ